jgi:NAD/NADP transhydrogenase beta subunit
MESCIVERSAYTPAADVQNPMFYMPNTKMLFGDAKDTCDGTYSKTMTFPLLIIFALQLSREA